MPSEIYALVVTLILSAWLLFFRLGHYTLWDDEAGTALNAKSLLATGDTSAHVDDHNVFAYRGGAELRDLKNRYLPPLPAGITAAGFRLSHRTDAFTARAPFAAMALGTIALLFRALRRVRAGPAASWILAAVILGNVSFALFSRQSRYYAAATLLSVAIALVYVHGRTARAAGCMAVLSILLFASNYLNYIALYWSLGVDYFLWRRCTRPFGRKAWAALLAPQMVACTAIALVWNPLRTESDARLSFGAVSDKAWLFLRLFSELNRNEFVCGGLLVLAGLLAWARKDEWLRRGLTSLVVYVAVVTVLTPRWADHPLSADIRYLVPVIPLGMLLAVRTLLLAVRRRLLLAVPIVLVACGSNLLHGGPLLDRGARSTIAEYLGELRDPPSDPFRVAADWIQCHVRPGESVAVLPDYMMYPLMFHAPHPIYAWQLPAEDRHRFRRLPPIHFLGVEEPKYLVAFGPSVEVWREWTRAGAPYGLYATLDHFWRDRHRPELTLRGFKPELFYNRYTEAIYVFKHR